MPSWIDNPQANYVLIAYGVAAFGLLALLFASWRELRARQATLQKIRSKPHESSQY